MNTPKPRSSENTVSICGSYPDDMTAQFLPRPRLTGASAVPPVARCGRLRVPVFCADPPARGPLATSSLRSGRCKRPRCPFPPGPSRFVFVSSNKIQSNHPGTLGIPWSGHLAPTPPTEGTPNPGGEGQRETLAHAQEAKPTSMRQGSHAPVGRRKSTEPAANRRQRRAEQRPSPSIYQLNRASWSSIRMRGSAMAAIWGSMIGRSPGVRW